MKMQFVEIVVIYLIINESFLVKLVVFIYFDFKKITNNYDTTDFSK